MRLGTLDRPNGREGDDDAALAVSDRPSRSRRPRVPHGSWSMRLPARWLRAALWEILLEPFVRLFYDLRAVGHERLAEGPSPVIFAANHCAHLDNGFIIMALPWPFRRRLAIAAASDDIFGRRHFGLPIKGMLARLIGNAFPFTTRRRAARIDYLQSLLEQRWSVLLFPEGKLTVGGPMRPFKHGVGLIAVETGVPVVPVRVDIVRPGPWEGAGRFSRGRIEVHFGSAIEVGRSADPAEVTARVEAAVKALAARP